MAFKYPVARRDETVKDKYLGVEVRENIYFLLFNINNRVIFQVSDPYRWLEDPDSEETKQYVDAQNALTRPFLDECVYKDKIKDCITKLWNYPKLSIPFKNGKYYYQYRNSGMCIQFKNEFN